MAEQQYTQRRDFLRNR